MRIPSASTRPVLFTIALGLVAASHAAPPAGADEATPPGSSHASDAQKADDATPSAAQVAELEKALTGAALVGRFTTTGEDGGRLTEERYELGEVRRLDGNEWLIQASIKYRDHDLTVPLTLPIYWAGDTPVIMVDNVAFPGLGTYSARVMIYKDHYAGFWTGNNHGGHLFGLVERGEKKASPATADDASGQSPAK